MVRGILLIVALVAGFAVPAHAAQHDDPAQIVFERTNAFRHDQKLAPLTWNAELAATAQAFAQFMASSGRYGHEADGRQPRQRAEQHGYADCIVDENIAYQQRSTPLSALELGSLFFEGWKNSPPHRHNMLDADVMDSAVAIAQSKGSGRWYAVQMFGRPASARITFEITNAGAATLQYRVADQPFQLPPKLTRTHEVCRAVEVSAQSSGNQPLTTIAPHDGERYAAIREASGAWRLERQ